MSRKSEILRGLTAVEELLAAEDEEVKVDENSKTARETLASEIEELEEKIASDEVEEVEEEVEKTSKKASEVDPDGAEEKITQNYLSEVESITHGEELTTGDSMLAIAPTEYVKRLRSASSRLDRVASYLEGTGRKSLAFRVDKVADSIDARASEIESGNL